MSKSIKSSFCNSGECVTAAAAPAGGVLVSREVDGHTKATIRFTDAEWEAFIAGVEAGEFGLDRLTAADGAT